MSKSGVTFGGETLTAKTVEGFTLEMNQDPDMQVSEIRAGAEDIELFERRILGRAEGLNENFDSAATEFTDVIKWNIETESAIQLGVWMDVCGSLRFCAAVTEEWADALSEYKEERRRLIQDWNDRASAYETVSSRGAPSDYTDSGNAENALKELKEEIEGDELRAHSNLSTKATEARSDLAYGATTEAVQRLIDGGYFTWSYFNLSGDIESLPIDISGEEAAEEVADFATDPDGNAENVIPIMGILNNIAFSAAGRQQNGGTLSSEELDFLNELYESLEEAGDERGGEIPGVLNITEEIIQNDQINEDDMALVLGGLGGGILTLSDESILGGYENLPQSIRDTVEGPDSNDPPSLEWNKNAQVLGQMMGHEKTGVQGGEQFSVNLTQSLGYAIEETEHKGEDEPGDEDEEKSTNPNARDEDSRSWWVENLAEVSTRNEDANHAILTGDGQYEHPVHGLDADQVLKSFYTFDWEDDGAAVSGITDWIWEQADGEDWEQERAGEAMASFMEFFGDPEFMNTISGTGHNVEGEATNDNGETVDAEWFNVSSGHLNPDIAWGWSELFTAYKGEFASEYGLPIGDIYPQNETHWDPDDGLMINPDQRSNFVQQIMGDGNAGAKVYAETMKYSREALEEFVENRDSINTTGAAEAGVLRGIVDTALAEEAETRDSKNEEAAEYQQKVRYYGIDMLGAAITETSVPGSALAAESIKIAGKEEFEIETFDAEQKVENNLGSWEAEEMFKLTAIHSLATGDPDINSMIPESIKNGENGGIHHDPSQWETSDDSAREEIDDVWRAIRDDNWGDSEATSDQALQDYIGTFERIREKIKEENEAESSSEE